MGLGEVLLKILLEHTCTTHCNQPAIEKFHEMFVLYTLLEIELHLGLNRCWNQLSRFGFIEYEIKKDVLLFFVCLVLLDKKNEDSDNAENNQKSNPSFSWSEICALSKSGVCEVFYHRLANDGDISSFISAQIHKHCGVRLWRFRKFPKLESHQLFRLIQRFKELNINSQTSFSTVLRFLQEKRSSRNSRQYFTPQHIATVIGTIAEEIDAQSVLDPSCGFGSLLASIKNSQEKTRSIEGCEIDPFLADCATFNLWLTGQQSFTILNKNALDHYLGKKQYDLIVANPPFGNGNPIYVGNKSSIKTKTSRIEVVFLDRIMALVKDAGCALVILPLGFLHSASKAHQLIRQRLVDEFQIEGIIELPMGVFLPATSIRTALLIFKRSKISLKKESIWYYKLNSDGFSADKIRRPIPENNLPDLIYSWTNRAAVQKNETSQAISYLSIDYVQQNKFILLPDSEMAGVNTQSPNKQKTVKELFKDLGCIEDKRRQKLSQLEKLLNE